MGYTTMDEVDRNMATALLIDEGRTYGDLWRAPESAGWLNKPHRYLYDALLECAALRKALARAQSELARAQVELARVVEADQ